MRTAQILVVDLDDDLAGQVGRAVTALRPRPGVLHCSGFDAVDAVRAEHGPLDLLVAGPSLASPEGLQQLRQFRADTPDTAVILAFDRLGGRLRDIVRTGAVDILRVPVSDDVVLAAVEQALDLVHPAAPGGDGQRRKGPNGPEVIAVVSAAGGSGKTFFAINLAYQLQTRGDSQTCLVDLDLQFGELSAALRLRPRYTIADLVRSGDGEDGDLTARLQEHVVVHDTGIRVLAGPDSPEQADEIDATDVGRVLDAARASFDRVIVDTPANLSEAVLVALERADQIYAIATLDLPCIRNLGILLSTLRALKVPSERIRLVLNKVERDAGINPDAVKKYFPQGFSMVIPYGREVNRALNMGIPVLAYAPRADVSKALATGLARVASPSGGEDGAAGERPRWRLRRRAAAG